VRCDPPQIYAIILLLCAGSSLEIALRRDPSSYSMNITISLPHALIEEVDRLAGGGRSRSARFRHVIRLGLAARNPSRGEAAQYFKGLGYGGFDDDAAA
jgi:hypothetical protein